MERAPHAKRRPVGGKRDGTSGRLSANSPQEAQEMAGEMCQVHQGVKGQPQQRSEQR